MLDCWVVIQVVSLTSLPFFTFPLLPIRTNSGTIEQKLVCIDRPILRVPNLAIHLQSPEERKAFAPNKENHLSPILAMKAEEALIGPTVDTAEESKDKSDDDGRSSTEEKDDDDDKETKKDKEVKDGWTEHQEPLLLQLIALELGIEVSDIVDFELNLFDTQKASLGGAYSEFVYSARLDNLDSCFLAVKALVEHVNDGKLVDDDDISLVALFDHEEVGSSSA